MKVLYLQDDFPPESFGGAGISVYMLARGMQEAGCEVVIITTCRTPAEAGVSVYEGLRVYKIVSDYPARWRAYRSLNNIPVVRQVEILLQEIRPDVVHINNVHYHLSYRCFQVAKKYASVVFTARDVMSFSYSKLQTNRYLEHLDGNVTWLDNLKQAKKGWNPLRNFFIRRYLKYADVRIAVSRSLKEALERNGIQNVDVIHTGVSLSLSDISEVALKDFQKKYSLQDKKVVFFGGRLSGGKGAKETLQAMVSVCDKVPNAALLVVGAVDGYAQNMKTRVAELGITSNVIFTNWLDREELKLAMAASDVVLVPSLSLDALPRCVLEAMACCKPVVGTRYGGSPEAILDGVTGYVVDPRNSDLIATKIIDLLSDEDKAKRFGGAGRERIESQFELNSMVAQYLARYQELIAA